MYFLKESAWQEETIFIFLHVRYGSKIVWSTTKNNSSQHKYKTLLVVVVENR